MYKIDQTRYDMKQFTKPHAIENANSYFLYMFNIKLIAKITWKNENPHKQKNDNLVIQRKL